METTDEKQVKPGKGHPLPGEGVELCFMAFNTLSGQRAAPEYSQNAEFSPFPFPFMTGKWR